MADGVSEHPRIVHATDERSAGQPLIAVVAASHRSSSPPQAASPHSRKFFAATAVLVGVAIGAVGIALIILIGGGVPGPTAAGEPWSAWSPTTGGIAGERQIAADVAPFYRAARPVQLAVVTVQNVAGPTTATGTAAGTATPTGTGSVSQIAVLDPAGGALAPLPGNTAVYDLCGEGPSCAITAGSPSPARLLLLRREALELALYTFRYVKGVDNVVALLPPGNTAAPAGRLTPKPPPPGATATKSSPIDIAVVFVRAGLQPFLNVPLLKTMAEPLPPLPAAMNAAPEAELVSVITGQLLFTQQLIQSPDGSKLLLLDPQPPQ
jgi:hypothetical protein